MQRTTLDRVEHGLSDLAARLHRLAIEAESLKDQGLADDLHQLHGDIVMRVLPSVRRRSSRSTLVT